MKNRKMGFVLILVALLLAVGGPLGYLWYSSSSVQQVRIATSKNAWCILTLVALDIGLFEKHGLVPEATYNAAGRINMDALLSGSADAANIVEMNIANAAKAGERDLLILGTIARSWDYAVVSKGRHTASAQTAAQHRFGYLRGQRIGYAPGTGAEPFLFSLLQKYGISETDVTLVRIPPTGLVEQFVAGSIDVAISWEPFVNTMSQRRGGDVTIQHDRSVFEGIMTLAVRRQWANENPETVERLLRVYTEAAAFVGQNDERAQEIVARRTELPLALVRSMWGRFEPAFRTDDPQASAVIQAAIDVVSRASTPSQTDVDYRIYFRR